MNITDINYVKELISKNYTLEAIEFIEKRITINKNKRTININDELIILKGRIEQITKDFNIGIVSREEKTASLIKINKYILSILNEITNNKNVSSKSNQKRETKSTKLISHIKNIDKTKFINYFMLISLILLSIIYFYSNINTPVHSKIYLKLFFFYILTHTVFIAFFASFRMKFLSLNVNRLLSILLVNISTATIISILLYLTELGVNTIDFTKEIIFPNIGLVCFFSSIYYFIFGDYYFRYTSIIFYSGINFSIILILFSLHSVLFNKYLNDPWIYVYTILVLLIPLILYNRKFLTLIKNWRNHNIGFDSLQFSVNLTALIILLVSIMYFLIFIPRVSGVRELAILLPLYLYLYLRGSINFYRVGLYNFRYKWF